MEDFEWSIELQARRHDADANDLRPLQEQIWAQIVGFIESYATDSISQHGVLRYIGEMDFFGDRWFAVEGQRMTFRFDNRHGDYPCSAALACYWSRVALAACLEAVEGETMQHGWSIASPRDDVQDVLRLDAGQGLFVALRDDLWLVTGPEDDFFVKSDTSAAAGGELDEAERGHVREVIRLRCSDDPMTSMLAPSAAFEASLRELATSADPEARATAVWYAGNVARPSLALVEAMLAVGATLGIERVRWQGRKLEHMGRRAADAALTPIRAALAHSHPAVRGLALAALAGFCDRRRSVDASPELCDAVLELLDDKAPANEIATDYLSRFRDPPSGAREVTERLLAVLERPHLTDSFRHDLLLGLFNLHQQERPVPAEVIAAFARDAEHPEPMVGDFAAWAHDALRADR